jgi:invasin D
MLNEGSADTSPKAKATLMLLERISNGKLSGQLTSNASVAGLEFARSAGQALLPEHREQIARDLFSGLATELELAFSDSRIENPIDTRASFDDILDGLQDLIGIVKDDYLDVYARLVEAYAKLYSEFNADVLARLTEWVSPQGDDKGTIVLDVGLLEQALQVLIARYSLPNPNSVLFPVPNDDGSVVGASQEDALKWLAAMGLPLSCLKQLPDGSYCVVMDLSPFSTMIDGMPARNGNGKASLLPAGFQAWQAAFNAQQQEVESALQKHTQKYSNANSIHDNVQKVISSTLSALFEMLKAFSAALG